MKKSIVLSVAAACLMVAGSASAQYGPAPCPVAVPCPPVQKAYFVPNTTSCYRTTAEPCPNPVRGVTGVLGKIFNPACNDTCKPCAPCL